MGRFDNADLRGCNMMVEWSETLDYRL
jgi:hypothetical protein